jgi:hypothetical protein
MRRGLQRPLPPAADMPPHTSGTAMCQQATYAAQQTAPLFDHLVGAGEQHRRNFEAQRLCGFQIDRYFEFGWQLYRKIGRFSTFEDLAGIDAGLPICAPEASPVADQATA